MNHLATVIVALFVLIGGHVKSAPVNVKLERDHVLTLDFVDVDLDGDDLVLRCRNDNAVNVVIRSDYSLWIKDSEVELTGRQKKLVMDFYNETFSLVQDALRLAKKGTRLGVKGATLGLSAAFEAIVAAIMGEDEDAIEERVTKKTDKIEAEAKRLEAEAKILEDRADNVTELLEKLFDRIPALSELKCK